jgi:hypothetical protein
MSLMSDFPAPPTRPEDYECCHRHCDPCIMDYYRAALARWKTRVREVGGDPDVILAGNG